MSAVSGASPDAYERHVGRYAKELSAGLIRVAGVRAGQSALDVGCGPGGLAVALAGLLGDENVAAVDPSERFVEVCRSRIPGADVRIGVAENLPFDDASFDAVLAQLVVQDIVDARNGVAEMRRVARPGGVVSGCVWDFESGMPLLRAAGTPHSRSTPNLPAHWAPIVDSRSHARTSSTSSGVQPTSRRWKSARSPPARTTRI